MTKKPSGELDAAITAGASNYDGYEGIAHVDLPRFNNISIKFDGLIEKRNGTVTNPLAGQPNFDAYSRKGAHVAALWEPSPTFSAEYAFDISHDATTPFYVQLVAPGRLPLAPILPVQPTRATAGNVGVPMQPSIGDTSGHLLTFAWKPLDHLTVKSIGSYRELTQSQFDNAETVLSVFAPNANFSRYSLANFDQYQYSEELQVIGDIPHVAFVGSAFYYHEHVQDNAFTPNSLMFNATGTAYTVLPTPIAATPFPDRASIAVTDSYAAFGQATLTPALLDETTHLTLGGRYSHDKKTGSLFAVNGATPTVNGVTAALPLDVSSNRFDPLINLSVDVARDITIYGKWSTGYKAGGANSRSLTYRSFGPESVSEFEVGAKTEFLDHRLRLNAAAYTGAYKNVQIDFNAVIPGANRGTLETTNTAGSGHIKGVEVDATLTPVRHLTLSASYAYTSVSLPPAPNPFVIGTPLVVVYPLYAPTDAASGAIDYDVPLGRAKLIAHLDGNYANGQYTSSTDPTKSDKSFIVNGRVSLAEIPLGRAAAQLQVSLWTRNLFDEAHIFVKNFNAALGIYAIYNEPRTFGIEGTVRF